MYRFGKIHNTLSLCMTLSLLIQLVTPLFITQSLAALPSANSNQLSLSHPQSLLSESDPIDVIQSPLTIVRTQSAYHTADTVNNTLTIEFTITNNQLPTAVPNTSNSTTYTDTMAALAAFNPTEDMNTLHDVTLQDTLTATFQIAISNTGSLATQYNLTLALGAASGSLPVTAMVLPAQAGLVQEVTVVVPQVGVYELAVTAVSPTGTTGEAMAMLTAVVTTPPPDGLTLYLPFISKNSN